MALADWTVIVGSKGVLTDEDKTEGNYSYQAPSEESVIVHNKTLDDQPKKGEISFDLKFSDDSSMVGGVFKASSSQFIGIRIRKA